MFVYNDSTKCSCESSLSRINDIIEVEAFIICTGKEFFEVFQFGQNGLCKHKQIAINNSEEIVPIKLVKKLFFCGHASGYLSIWKPGSNPFLSCDRSEKIHDGKVNEIAVKIVDECSTFVITCSDDAFLKVFNLESNLKMIFVNKFRAAVLSCVNVVDYEGNDKFVISLGDGSIQCTDANFKVLFDVPSKYGDVGLRNAIAFTNPFKNEKLGDFLIMVDGTMLNVSMWIKDGSFEVNKGNDFHHGGQAHYGQGSRGRGKNRGRGRGWN